MKVIELKTGPLAGATVVINEFAKLDAQDEMGRLAQVGPHEQDPHEFDTWQQQVATANLEAEK